MLPGRGKEISKVLPSARLGEAFGFLGDFKIRLGISKKTFKRMVERAKASAESNDDA